MRQFIVYSKKTLLKKGANVEKLQQYNANSSLKTTQNDRAFLPASVLKYSELSASCKYKKAEKDNHTLRLYCMLVGEGSENVKCALKNCPKING